jgi:hypothetical protein
LSGFVYHVSVGVPPPPPPPQDARVPLTVNVMTAANAARVRAPDGGVGLDARFTPVIGTIALGELRRPPGVARGGAARHC